MTRKCLKTLLLNLNLLLMIPVTVVGQTVRSHASPPEAVKPDGCNWHFKRSQICAKITAWNLAGVGRESTFEFVTMDARGSLLTAEPVFVDLWMNMGSHGHGSAPVTVQAIGPANYRVTKVHFVMAGSWDIRLTLAAGTPEAETSIFHVMVPRSSSFGR